MNIGDYLRNNYHASNVQEIVINGQLRGYYAKSSNGDEIYLPANTTGDVGMLSYIPGAGGSGNDAAMLREIIKNNPPTYPITIARSCSDHNNCIETGYAIAKGANMNVTNNVTVCFSASGYLGIQRTESFEDNHPNVTSTVVSCEPYGEGNYRIKSNADVNGLVNSKSKVIFVAPQSGFHLNMAEESKKLESNGIESFFLGTKYSGNSGSVHIATNRDVLSSGMVDYLLGYSDSFNQNPGNGKYSPNYKLVKYNKETGQFENAGYEDLASGLAAIRVPDLDKLKAVDPFNIENKESPVKKKYQGLSSVGAKEITGTSMKTNVIYAKDEMNKLRELASKTSFLTSFGNISSRSSSGIPGCIGAYINAYYDIVGSLLNSLVLETDAALSYTQAIVDLDADLAASQTPGQIVADGELKGYIKIGLEGYEDTSKAQEKEKEQTTGETTTGGTTTGTTTGGTTTGETTMGGTTTGGYVPPVVPETPPSTEAPEEVPKYIYDFKGYQGLIYMKDGKISEIKFRYSYGTEEEAKSHLTEVRQQYFEKEFIKEVVQNGKYIDAIFNKDFIKGQTYEDIVKDFFKGGRLHG